MPKENNYKINLPVSILGVGMALAATYLNTNGESAFFLWLGVFLCFLKVTNE